MDEKQAREIVDEFRNSVNIFKSVHPNAKAYFIAEGFLVGLEAERKRAEKVVEAINQFVHPYVRCQCVHGILLDQVQLERMQAALAEYEAEKIKP